MSTNTQGALGGSFNPAVDYPITGNWSVKSGATLTIDSGATLAVNGTMTDTGSTLVSPVISGTVTGGASYTAPTLTSPTITGTTAIGAGATLTTPTIATGLTASGSAANDFSASTGTFLTSSGANTLSGAVSIADATTPSLTTATGKTNTGFVTVLGKTSGGLKLFTADATGQTVTVAPIAQTVGATTLSIPDMAGASDTFVFQAKAQAFTGKIMSDNKYVAAVTYDNTSVLADITGLSWTVVAGASYQYELILPTTQTTVGGLKVAFALTTATLTAMRYITYQTTATDNTGAVSSTGTTTASGTAMVDNKTAAYTQTRIIGTFVVGTGGTFKFQAAQNTGATGGDVSILLVGGYATLQRLA